jgi:integrase
VRRGHIIAAANHQRLTKTLLVGLVAPEAGKRQVIYDTEIPKLGMRISHTGVRAFYVVKRLGGTMVWIKLGTFPDMTCEQARNEAGKILGEFAKGENPAAVKRAVKAELTFGEAFDDFLERKRKRDGSPISDKTKRDYSDLLRLYLDGLKDKKLSLIERNEVKAIHAKTTKKSAAQADRVVAVVSAVFTFMQANERFSGLNPATMIQKNPAPSRDRFLQPDELTPFFKALSESTNGIMRDFFLMSLLTGARRANVSAMRWSDVDLVAGIWRIPKTKNGTPQSVTLSPEAVSVLNSRRAGGEFVFPGEGKTGHIVEPKKAWANLIKSAGIENLRIHDLRRTLGSWQARTGASLPIIGKSLNHKTHQATAIYARLDLDPVRQSVNTATTAIMEAAGMNKKSEVVPVRLAKT